MSFASRSVGFLASVLLCFSVVPCAFAAQARRNPQIGAGRDKNGWGQSREGGKHAAGATIFNHNLYISSGCHNTTVRGNIIANASSHGMQLRNGGTVEDNLFLRNPLNFFVAGSPSLVCNNVVLGSADISSRLPRGEGSSIFTDHDVTVENNIVAHKSEDVGRSRGIRVMRVIKNIVLRNNTVCNWYGTGLSVLAEQAENITVRNNIVQNTAYDTPLVEATGLPGRDVDSYHKSLGREGAFDAFMAEVRKQSELNWRPEYTAAAVNAYIREGFRPMTALSNLQVGAVSADYK